MKKTALFHIIFIIFAFFAMFSSFTNNVCFATDSVEDEIGEVAKEELEKIDFDALDEYLYSSDFNIDIFDGSSTKDIVAMIINGELKTDIFSILNYIISSVKENIKNYLSAMLVILVIVLLCFLFNKLKSNMQKQSIEEIIYFICFASIITIIIKLSTGIINDAADAIFSIQKQMNIILPILLTMMTTIGANGTVAVFTPLVAFLSNVIANLFSFFLFPLFSLVFILSIVNNISKKTRFENLIKFCNSLFKWVIGTCLTVYFIFFTMQGISASTTDGLSFKVAKFAVKNYVPIFGGYVSEGVSVVKVGVMLIRNAVGLVGVIIMFGSIVGPVFAIGVFSLILKFMAGILEPLGDKSVNILSAVGDSFKLLLTSLVGICVMYLATLIFIITSFTGVV